MELAELKELSKSYAEALQNELSCKRTVALAQGGLLTVEAAVLRKAYEDGTINGKNADVRKQQETDLLASDVSVVKAAELLASVQEEADGAEVTRKRWEVEIGLIRAWLYSQAQIG